MSTVATPARSVASPVTGRDAIGGASKVLVQPTARRATHAPTAASRARGSEAERIRRLLQGLVEDAPGIGVEAQAQAQRPRHLALRRLCRGPHAGAPSQHEVEGPPREL